MRPKKAQQITKIIDAPGEVQKGYLASWLVVCTLPHRDPKTEKYTRTNGDCTLTIQSGTDKGKYLGLPYGSLPRLLFFWMVSEANRLKANEDESRRLHLGHSINRFLLLVGLDPKTGNGKRGDMQRLREQMRRLFRCRISFDRTVTISGTTGYKWLDMDIAPDGELWWDVKDPDQDPDQAVLFESWIELGEKFYKAITTSPVPFDFRALCALKHSPMAIDLYTWLTWRVHSMQDGSSAKIPLHGPKGIAEQIGSNYSRERDFKAALSEGLETVKLVWPQMNCDLSATHLTVRRSPVPISDVPPVKKRRAFGQVKPDELSIETVIAFKKAFPEVRLNPVWKAYKAFLAREKITPRDIDAHFQDYAAKWAKGRF